MALLWLFDKFEDERSSEALRGAGLWCWWQWPLGSFGQVEGPYDKCKDYELNGDPKEYYTLIMEVTWKTKESDKGVVKTH